VCHEEEAAASDCNKKKGTEDDGLSTVFTLYEDELSHEQQLKQLQMIKARTMYEMVEELEGGARKILFLTNEQVMDTFSYGSMFGPFDNCLSICCAGRAVGQEWSGAGAHVRSP